MSRRLTLRDERWPLAAAFVIARGAKTEAHVIVAEIAATIRERMGGPRVESDWDKRPCWELYDDLRQEAEESFAREMGLFDAGSS